MFPIQIWLTPNMQYTVHRAKTKSISLSDKHSESLSNSNVQSFITRIDYMISPSNYQMFSYTGWPIKTETAYYQHYEDAITGISA